MKKKRFGIMLLSVLLAVLMMALAACSSSTLPELDDVKPWGEKNKLCSEDVTYSFSRYITSLSYDKNTASADDSKDKGYLITQSGTLKYTLTEGRTLSFDKTSNKVVADNIESDNTTLLKMEFETVYKSDLSHLPVNQEVKNLYAGKTDTIISYTVLDSLTLATIFTYKQTDIGAQSDGDTQSFTLIADYTGDFTDKKQATVIDSAGTKTVDIKKGEYYDSESVYYRIRSMNTVKGGSAAAFSLAMPYDDALVGESKLQERGAQQSTAEDSVAITLSESAYSFFDVKTADANYELDCYKTTLALTASQAGHGINLYYAADKIKKDQEKGCYHATSKVLVKIEYPNNDRLTGLEYNQEYILSEYSNGIA